MSMRIFLIGLLLAGTACDQDRHARTEAAAPPPLTTLAPVSPPVVTDFEPKKGKGSWARAEWRRPSNSCQSSQKEPPEPTGDAPLRKHWMETCDASAEPELVVTIHGSGFAVPAARNAVFFGGVAAEIVSGDAATLVVRPRGGPRQAPIAVRTSPAPNDDPRATDRAVSAAAFTFIGPPEKVKVLEGDGQVVAPGSPFKRVAVQVTDAEGEGVPGERVWFWVMATTRDSPRWPEKPLRIDASTGMLGIATAQVTAGNAAGIVKIQAEAVNAGMDGLPVPRSSFKAIITPPTEAFDKHLKNLAGGDPSSRAAAAYAIGFYGPGASSAVPGLLAAANDPDLGVRLAAAEALGRIGTPEAVKGALAVLRPLLDYPDDERRRSVVSTLGQMGPAAKDAVPDLARALRRPRERYGILDALMRIGKDAAAAVPALIDVLSDRDDLVRHRAVEVLASIGLPSAEPAIPALRAALKDESSSVQAVAERTLSGWLGSQPHFTMACLQENPSIKAGSSVQVRAKVTDLEGRPVPYERVVFSLLWGSATIDPLTALTNGEGLATTLVSIKRGDDSPNIEAKHGSRSCQFPLKSVW